MLVGAVDASSRRAPRFSSSVLGFNLVGEGLRDALDRPDPGGAESCAGSSSAWPPLAGAAALSRPPSRPLTRRTPPPAGEARFARRASPTSARSTPPSRAMTWPSSALQDLFAGLVDYDASAQIVPDLAPRSRSRPDGLVYRFFLREGVRFHDGEELRADGRPAMNRARAAPDHPQPGGEPLRHDLSDTTRTRRQGRAPGGVVVEGVRRLHPPARDRRAVPPVLALHTLRPVCQTAGERYSDTWEPCGAGPYRLPPGGWDRGRSLTLVRHEGYFRPGLPYLDSIEWTFRMNRASELYAFEDGDLDITHDLGEADVVSVPDRPALDPFVLPEPDRTLDGEVMNTEIPPFDNVEVRRAVAAAIDRDDYHAYKPESLTPSARRSPCRPRVRPALRGADVRLRGALAHMAKAGFPYDPTTGRGATWGSSPTTSSAKARPSTPCRSSEQQLAHIRAPPRGPPGQLGDVSLPRGHARAVAMSSPGWSMDYPDPADFFEALFASNAINAEQSNNMAFYRNAGLDALVEKRARHDPTRRAALFAEANPSSATTLLGVHRHPPLLGRRAAVRARLRPHPVWAFDTSTTWVDRPGKGRRDGLGALWPPRVPHCPLPRVRRRRDAVKRVPARWAGRSSSSGRSSRSPSSSQRPPERPGAHGRRAAGASGGRRAHP